MLWQALDNTGNGSASLEELDPSCARLLARFKDFGDKKFGTRPAIPLWRAIDKRDKQRISYDVFVRRCTVMRSGLTEAELQELSHWLDWQGKPLGVKMCCQFLDHWRPPAYLVAEPNQAAADHIRSMLITKYGHYLKAWRTLLDKDSSNVCNWDEFNNAMRYLKFHGDVGEAEDDLETTRNSSIINQRNLCAGMKFDVTDEGQLALEHLKGILGYLYILQNRKRVARLAIYDYGQDAKPGAGVAQSSRALLRTVRVARPMTRQDPVSLRQKFNRTAVRRRKPETGPKLNAKGRSLAMAMAKPDFSKRDDVVLNRFGHPDTLILVQGRRLFAHYDILSLDDETAYKRFREVHNRSSTGDQLTYQQRLENFRKFRAAVEQHNSRSDVSWTAVITKFADYTDAEYRVLLGQRRTWRPEITTGSSFLQTGPRGEAKTVDWSKTLSSVKNVKEQGGCGSCWAVAAIGALEMHAELALRKAIGALSSNQVKDCSSNIHHCGGTGGCGGSTSELAYDWIVKNGVALDDVYHGDKDHDEKCTQTPAYLKVGGFQPLPTNKLQPLMAALTTKGPVVVSIDAAGWNFYGGGVFDTCDRNAVVNHAVVLVGFGHDNEQNKDYWLIRNSWGDGWGEGGFIRLLRHSGDQGDAGYCGIDSKPQEGTGCDNGPPTVPVCGMCGVLSDSVYPYGVQLA
ncbi:Probable cysteine protease RD21B [Durusdinium trenchii]|uniref:Probable cysteine protease RD21B n=1 Tax=Durusdinium trenchii TaxID=1381693 RepID=A0ABP0QYB1_9DINO